MAKDYHAKGQQDAANGKYDLPHSRPGGAWLSNYTKQELQDINDYKAGWRHHKDN